MKRRSGIVEAYSTRDAFFGTPPLFELGEAEVSKQKSPIKGEEC